MKRDDPGNAIIEFVGVLAIFIVPIVVLLVGMAQVFQGQMALDAASRNAARAFVRADSSAVAPRLARDAALDSWNTYSSVNMPLAVTFDCSASPCLTPGASVNVTLSAEVKIPYIGATFTLNASSTQIVDLYRRAR